MRVIKHFVDGKTFEGSSKRTSKVFNPATGEETSQVNLASKPDTDFVVEKAKKAFKGWSNKPPVIRARVLFKFKELVEKNSDELTKLIVSEHGKVYDDAKGSLTRGLEVVEFACGIPQLLKGEFTENVGTEVDSWSTRQPLGVCAGITPFNFPAMVPMWMFPLAIACGNTFILKPSEKDPSCSIMLAQLFKEAGLPDGVFNVVNGDKEVVDAFLTAFQVLNKPNRFDIDMLWHLSLVLPDSATSLLIDNIRGVYACDDIRAISKKIVKTRGNTGVLTIIDKHLTKARGRNERELKRMRKQYGG